MNQAATREHEPTEAEQHKRDEEARKLAEALAEAQAERDADNARFDALFGGEEEQRQRANRTLAEQSAFDARSLWRRASFGAMAHAERETYLDAQEKLTPEQRNAPELQHETEMAQELLLVYMENRPIPDKLFNDLLGLVKAHNLPPPEGGATGRTAAERQAIRDEADAEKRAARTRT